MLVSLVVCVVSLVLRDIYVHSHLSAELGATMNTRLQLVDHGMDGGIIQ